MKQKDVSCKTQLVVGTNYLKRYVYKYLHHANNMLIYENVNINNCCLPESEPNKVMYGDMLNGPGRLCLTTGMGVTSASTCFCNTIFCSVFTLGRRCSGNSTYDSVTTVS